MGYAIQAAERATRMLAWEEAAELYELALRTLDLQARGAGEGTPQASLQRGEILLELGHS